MCRVLPKQSLHISILTINPLFISVNAGYLLNTQTWTHDDVSFEANLGGKDISKVDSATRLSIHHVPFDLNQFPPPSSKTSIWSSIQKGGNKKRNFI